ncbi:hypothetical protein POVWA2_041100 [Plasmodium ovale wallikeri]|uniref:Uncharacterized protein n=1 Tax=Plasmodium ovale wallikeri TaxID=864142 RepID=A0A1A8ZAZ3_PLAOA|nr:hypothetical protein POVWA1_042600 [Plasmodium ovale wallikeri]SBT41041.1 hypothetical protein POVWA2_041100 [Plasmodium ovale wallikeri]
MYRSVLVRKKNEESGKKKEERRKHKYGFCERTVFPFMPFSATLSSVEAAHWHRKDMHNKSATFHCSTRQDELKVK